MPKGIKGKNKTDRAYSVILNEAATEKVRVVLKKANLSLSGFLNVMVCNFAEMIDEEGMSEKMDNLTVAGAFEMLANIFGKIEDEQARERELRKNVKEKES